jgi:predicted RNase H-like HicB family nuclease
MGKYSTVIYWSNQDEAFIAEVPELKGCIAHGETGEIALKNIVNEWLIVAKEENWEIPRPKVD